MANAAKRFVDASSSILMYAWRPWPIGEKLQHGSLLDLLLKGRRRLSHRLGGRAGTTSAYD